MRLVHIPLDGPLTIIGNFAPAELERFKRVSCLLKLVVEYWFNEITFELWTARPSSNSSSMVLVPFRCKMALLIIVREFLSIKFLSVTRGVKGLSVDNSLCLIWGSLPETFFDKVPLVSWEMEALASAMICEAVFPLLVLKKEFSMIYLHYCNWAFTFSL